MHTYVPTSHVRVALAGAVLTLLLIGAGCSKVETSPSSIPSAEQQVPTYTRKVVIDSVTWPAQDKMDQKALQALPAAEAAKIVGSGVPVLVPNDPKFLSKGIMVYPNGNGYDFGMPDPVDGITITVGGGRVSIQSDAPIPPHAYDEDPNALSLRGTRVSIGRTESASWKATWSENGEASYMLDLDCVQPGDPRCADKAYVIDLVKNLVYVGGSGK